MFISYAQNLEDVILFRALRKVERGFYVDTDARDPSVDSVTKAFYDRGWRGINLEPRGHWLERLKTERPEDVNLQVAAWSRPTTIRVYEVVGTLFSTVDRNLAAHYAAQGFAVREVDISARPLREVCADLGVKEVHFLKVGMDGAEIEVLSGLDLGAVRPWIIVVRSIAPNSLDSTHERWEPTVTAWDYEFVYFDGVNRFYVARERDKLKVSFAAPPSHYEHYVRMSQHLVEARLAALVTEYETLQREAESLRRRLRQAESERAALGQTAYVLRLSLAEERRISAELRRNLELLLSSRSMRVTSILRAATRWVSSLERAGREALEGSVDILQRAVQAASRHRLLAGFRKRVPAGRDLPMANSDGEPDGDPFATEGQRFAVAEAMHPLVDLVELQTQVRRAARK